VRFEQPSIDQEEAIRAQIVREIYERSRSSIATLIAVVFLFGWALVRTHRTDGVIHGLVALLMVVSVLRWLLAMIPSARWEALASVQTRMRIFTVGVIVTSATLATLVIRVWPILETPHFAILAAVISGIVAGAVMSLGASPRLHSLYSLPPVGAMFWRAITDTRPPWGADLLATAILLYAAMTVVLTIDHARTRRRGIHLSLQLSDLALRDALTQLRNRRFLQEYMSVEAARLARDATERARGHVSLNEDVLALYMIDLDHFKSVNDNFGHAAGDAVLKQIAEVLDVRKSDIVVRWGGEEFVIAARLRQRDDASGLAETLRHRMEAANFVLPDGSTLRRTCSIGFCAIPFGAGQSQPLDWEYALGLADAALYLAKAEGRNRWVGVQPGASPWPDCGARYLEIRDDLKQACDRGVIVLQRMAPLGSLGSSHVA
jgi:diguanylate cyclase (GGDEF)-like protein